MQVSFFPVSFAPGVGLLGEKDGWADEGHRIFVFLYWKGLTFFGVSPESRVSAVG